MVCIDTLRELISPPSCEAQASQTMGCKARQLKLSNDAKATGGTEAPCRGMFLKREGDHQLHFGKPSARTVLMSSNQSLMSGVKVQAGGEVQIWLVVHRRPDVAGMRRDMTVMIRDTQEMPCFLSTIS